ncbi:MAG: dTDP-4-dehydrorhamnose 3,5-epimerase [Oscillospiraceae bacterium]|nr:dTDP-4-dehydrorhamnose 3,5-epimerase [Oscillospiraceae bacterium]
MDCVMTKIPGVVVLTPRVFEDARGWFCESYNARALEELGVHTRFVQDNRSYSAKAGTLRGLHAQAAPHEQAKLVSCTRGRVLDVAVDVRADSPTYLQWVAVELSAENRCQLFVPRGCLHGFVTLCDDVEVCYKVDAHYAPEHDLTVRWDDPAFGIDWGVDAPILSQKDANAKGWGARNCTPCPAGHPPLKRGTGA